MSMEVSMRDAKKILLTSHAYYLMLWTRTTWIFLPDWQLT